jgi:membrane protease YdiL (CAAX protease family)
MPGASTSPSVVAAAAAVPRRALAQTLLFFAATYAVSWVCWGAASRAGSALAIALLLLGSIAPSTVAVALTARHSGRSGVRRLLGRLLRWRVGLRWYLFALGYIPVLKLAVALVHRATTGDWPRFGGAAWYAILPSIVVAGVVGGPLGEEVGWRGYALPRLTERFGPAAASVLLGVVWACWHLPLFVVSGLGSISDQYGQSVPTYVLQVTALSVAIAWLTNNTGGSLLLAVLMHSAFNQTKDIVPSGVPGAHDPWALSSSLPAWITVALLWVGAAFFLVRMHRDARSVPA